MNDALLTLYHMAVALAIGLLIGIERGWKERESEEGMRVAGVRTYGLIGLLGGGSALLAKQFGVLVMGLVFIGLAGVMTTGYIVRLRHENDVSITSLISGLLCFILSALAATGEIVIATAFAIVTTLLLSYKPQLHSWLRTLNNEELRAGIKLLLISVVLLPILPDQGYGPWQVLNPYKIWWMVVLIAAISFIGYFAIKVGGSHRGVLFTGLFSGLASSTALTLQFSRMSRYDPALSAILAMGVLLACGTMFPRMVLVACVLNPELFKLMLVPATVMAVLLYLPAISYWITKKGENTSTASPLTNPLELKTALSFGLLLGLIMFLGKAMQIWFGGASVILLAAASGVADVDAITLSLARMSQNDLEMNIAVSGIVIAAAVNCLVKAGMAAIIGSPMLGLRVGLPLLVSAAGGLISVWILLW